VRSVLHTRQWYRTENLARLLIALVLISNLYAALGFLFSPQQFISAYELAGVSGEAAVAGIGLLFVMWQVPYLAAIFNPIKHRFSLIEALIMQGLGVIGETFIRLRIPSQHIILRSGITRFIIFDLAGLALLATALLIINRMHNENERKNGV
jgi:hypothetical protein